MNPEIYNRCKPHVNVGTIGHVEGDIDALQVIDGVPYEELGQADFEQMMDRQPKAWREYNQGKFRV